MKYLIVSNSFAAPFFSDTNTTLINSNIVPEEALLKFVREYSHPSGLYSASLYLNAESYHEGKAPLIKWLCNKEIKKQELTLGKGVYSYLGIAPGKFKIDGVLTEITNPREGKIVHGNIKMD